MKLAFKEKEGSHFSKEKHLRKGIDALTLQIQGDREQYIFINI